MGSSAAESDVRIALFVDTENLVRGASTIGLPVDIGPVLGKLKEYGKVQIRRCFGDLERNVKSWQEREQIRRMLHSNLMQIEDVPFITQYKNTADMRLSLIHI